MYHIFKHFVKICIIIVALSSGLAISPLSNRALVYNRIRQTMNHVWYQVLFAKLSKFNEVPTELTI